MSADAWNSISFRPADASGDYVAFDGSMYSYDSDAKGWAIGSSLYFADLSQDQVNEIRNSTSAFYNPYTTYDAYAYNDGYDRLFTKGASYGEIYNQ